jgi:DNA gyrase inhibitor GyrI
MEILETPDMALAFVPTVGAKNNKASFEKLMEWACRKGFSNDNTQWLTIYTNFVDEIKPIDDSMLEKMTLKACMTLDENIELTEGIELCQLKKGKWAVGSFEVLEDSAIISACWKKLVIWSREQGYTKADRAAMEIYRSPLGPDNKYKVDLYYPVL